MVIVYYEIESILYQMIFCTWCRDFNKKKQIPMLAVPLHVYVLLYVHKQ